MQEPAPRRGDDRTMLAEIGTRLALVEQAQRQAATATAENAEALRRQIEQLSADIRAAAILQAAANAEAVATPAGRSLVARLDRHHEQLEDHERRLDIHQAFIDTFTGSMRGFKAMVIILSFITGVLSVLTYFASVAPPGPGS